VVVSAANSAARKRPRTSDQGPRAVEDQAVQAAQRPGGSGPRNSEENGSGRRAANADSEAKALTAVELDDADLDSEAELESFDDIDADDADLADAADLEVLADEDLEDTDDIVDVVDVAEEGAADDGPDEPEAAEAGLSTRRTGTSISILGVDENGHPFEGERRQANLEDVFVLLTGEEIE